jgi:hypothetical protein
VGAAGVLSLSFAQAPFQHAHASDPHHVHARGFTHAHWGAYPDGGSWEAGDHESDARMIDWLAGDGSAPATFVVVLPDASASVVVAVHAVRVPEFTPRNHDPPRRLTPDVRGPPA